MKIHDIIIIGGGQAGLSVAYFLRRHRFDYLILDDQKEVGGSWLKTWDNLKLFSPTEYSSLSGWGMPKSEDEYPTKFEFLEYLKMYQKRYDFPIKRNIEVINVHKEKDIFRIETNTEIFYSKRLVSATGTARNPFIPEYSTAKYFLGKQIHSLTYKNAIELKNKKILIVGGGNSGAQILAEVSKVAETKWVTIEEPAFLPDTIDGRYLFKEANQRFFSTPKLTSENTAKASLSNIVMIKSVREARKRGVLVALRPFKDFYTKGVIWDNDIKEEFDAVIWCTGFRANLTHLKALNIIKDNRIKTEHSRSIEEPNLWLVGYGNWTGFASATIYGVGKTAKQTVHEIANSLK